MRFIGRGLMALDQGNDLVLHRLTVLWSKVTGRSNFSLARGTLYLGLVLMSAGFMAAYALDPNTWNAISLLVVPLWMWLAHRRLQFYRELERNADQTQDGGLALRLDPRELTRFVLDRLFYAAWAWALVPGVALLRPTSIGIMLWIWSHYFVMHFDCKGGKSLVRSAVELLQKTGSKVAEKARDLVPQPAPQPIPIPVGA